MNENIDLTQILKDCPKGTKFYSTIDGEIEFVEMCHDTGLLYFTDHRASLVYLKTGRVHKDKGECVLFPSKEQRDWSKFKAPNKKVKVTLHPFDKVLVRVGSALPWIAHIVSFITDEEIETIDDEAWCLGIPYNKDTAHLLGTCDECPIDYEIEFSKEFKEE